MNRRTETIPASYFDGLYATDADPWQFQTSDYERDKYRETLAQLDGATYAAALEVGCSIGVFTRMLAPRCDRLLAVDASAVALDVARCACTDLPQVTFDLRMVPHGFPAGAYDLIVLSEVLYYLTAADLGETAILCGESLRVGGELVLCHWLGDTDYPLTGDQAADGFAGALLNGSFERRTLRRPRFRLDHFRRTE